MSGSSPEDSSHTSHHGHALHPPARLSYCPPTHRILDVINDNIVGNRWDSQRWQQAQVSAALQ